jgi:hypothetical protein
MVSEVVTIQAMLSVFLDRLLQNLNCLGVELEMSLAIRGVGDFVPIMREVSIGV